MQKGLRVDFHRSPIDHILPACMGLMSIECYSGLATSALAATAAREVHIH